MVIKKIIFVYNGDDIIGFRYDLKTIEHVGEMVGVSHILTNGLEFDS